MKSKHVWMGVRRRRRARQNDGFSLLELAFAVALLSVVMAGAYGLVAQSAYMIKAGRDHYIAISLAQNRMERAKNLTYDDLDLFAETDILIDTKGNPATEGVFRRSTDVDVGYAEGVTKIDIKVEIKDKKNGSFETGPFEILSTMLTEYSETAETL